MTSLIDLFFQTMFNGYLQIMIPFSLNSYSIFIKIRKFLSNFRSFNKNPLTPQIYSKFMKCPGNFYIGLYSVCPLYTQHKTGGYSIFIYHRTIIRFFFLFESKFNQNFSNYPTDQDKFVDFSTLMKSEQFPIFFDYYDFNLISIWMKSNRLQIFLSFFIKSCQKETI